MTEPKVELLKIIITKVFEVTVDKRKFIVKRIDKQENSVIKYEISEDLGNELRPKIYKAVQEFNDELIDHQEEELRDELRDEVEDEVRNTVREEVEEDFNEEKKQELRLEIIKKDVIDRL